MDTQLYIVRGTGLSLDGSVVIATERVGDYFLVSPPNSTVNIRGTMVHEKCLQPLDGDKTVVYKFTIHKYENDKVLPVEVEFKIEDAVRNVPLETIVEYIETNLIPILRME